MVREMYYFDGQFYETYREAEDIVTPHNKSESYSW